MPEAFDPFDGRSYLERVRDSGLPAERWKAQSGLLESGEVDAATVMRVVGPHALMFLAASAVATGLVLWPVLGVMNEHGWASSAWSTWAATAVATLAFGSGTLGLALSPQELRTGLPRASLLALTLRGRSGGARRPPGSEAVVTATRGARGVAVGLIAASTSAAAIAAHYPETGVLLAIVLGWGTSLVMTVASVRFRQLRGLRPFWFGRRKRPGRRHPRARRFGEATVKRIARAERSRSGQRTGRPQPRR